MASTDDQKAVDNALATAQRDAEQEADGSAGPPGPSHFSSRAGSKGDGSTRKLNDLVDQARWAEEVRKRLRVARHSLRHNDKRAMTFGGLALVLCAFGAALFVNKFQAGDSARAVDVHPQVLGVLCVLAAAAIWVARLGTKWREALRTMKELVATLRKRRDRKLNAPLPETSGERRSDPQRGEGWTVLLAGSLVLATAGGTLLLSNLSAARDPWSVGQAPLGVGLLSTALGLLVIAVYYSRKARRDEQELADLQFEHDLLRYKVEPFESRAEKLLSVNQVQLRRYYELNLQQARAVFIVGLACIAAGLAVVGVTLWLINTSPTNADDNRTQIIIALVGSVGTLLTNYVAAMYFKMFNAISRSLVNFHRELASTHNLFFANVLTTGIKGDPVRSKTLMKLALALAEQKVAHAVAINKEETA